MTLNKITIFCDIYIFVWKKWTSFQFRCQLNFIKNTQYIMKVIDLVTSLKGTLKDNKILVYIITTLNFWGS